jgi:hypothetical protein
VEFSAGFALINQLREDYVRAQSSSKETKVPELRGLSSGVLDSLECSLGDVKCLDDIFRELSALHSSLTASLRNDCAMTASSVPTVQELLTIDNPTNASETIANELLRVSGQLYTPTFQDLLRLLLKENVSLHARRHNPSARSDTVENTVSLLGTVVLRIIRTAQVSNLMYWCGRLQL